MPDDSVEPPLRDVFIDQACEVLYDAYDKAAGSITGQRRTWPWLTQTERAVAKQAMGELLDWLDARRL